MSHKRNQNQRMEGYYTTERINIEAIKATQAEVRIYSYNVQRESLGL